MVQVCQLVDMGFPRADAVRALEQSNASLEQAVALLCAGTLGAEPEPAPPVRSAALLPAEALPSITGRRLCEDQHPGGEHPGGEHSARTAAAQDPPLGPVALRWADDPEMSAGQELPGVREPLASPRKDGLPCGLLNIGNTCYVNSLLQTLLHIAEFRESMLAYRTPAEAGGPGEAQDARAEPEVEQGRPSEAPGAGQRRAHCLKLSSELRRLFAYSLFTARSCMDPSRLLSELVDQRGQKLPIGSQEDVGEFMLKFMEQLDEGVRAGRVESWPGPQEAVQRALGVGGAGLDAGKGSAEGTSDGGAVHQAGDPPGCSEAALGSKDTAAAPEAGGPACESQGEAEEKGERGTEAAPAEKKGDPLEQQERVSLLQKLFFGEQTQILTYGPSSPEGSPTKDGSMDEGEGLLQKGGEAGEESQVTASEERSDFLQIFLEVNRGDFYEAWEAANCTEVDYTTPGGEATTASKSIWIERLPKVLFFQLQRVGFDQENKAQVKLHDPFHFPSKVYADRFLRPNRAAAARAAGRVRGLRRRRAELAGALRGFEACQPGASAEQVLGWAADCLDGNSAAVASKPGRPGAGEAGAASADTRTRTAWRSRGPPEPQS
ncbi:unnamed protein product [Prorocentrum cordatum]|uniref:Ubiquitinyl hydrolase 1 n=1 Tax=Prorocentrum cordatum TaxID=2364126 RepID=A0ABN9U9J7_9DINO|nr:unnamed protein product [Polarella glacialis]